MSYLIFKNPRIKYRKEDFGGLLKTDKGIFIIDKDVFEFLNSFSQEMEDNISNSEIINILLEVNGLIKIKQEDALCIIKNQKQKK